METKSQVVPADGSSNPAVPSKGTGRARKKRTTGPRLVVTGDVAPASVTPVEQPNPSKNIPTAQQIDRLGQIEAILSDWAVQAKPYQVEAEKLEKQILAALEH